MNASQKGNYKSSEIKNVNNDVNKNGKLTKITRYL